MNQTLSASLFILKLLFLVFEEFLSYSMRMVKLTHKETERIKQLRALFPREIKVHMSRSQDGGFVAEVLDYPGCITEADTLSALIDMVNDAVYSMLEVPKKYISYMPVYLMPLGVAQRFNIFPVKNTDGNLKLFTHEPSAR